MTRTDLPAFGQTPGAGDAAPPPPDRGDEADRRWWRSAAPEMMLLLEQVRDLPDLPDDLRERAERLVKGMKRHYAALIR